MPGTLWQISSLVSITEDNFDGIVYMKRPAKERQDGQRNSTEGGETDMSEFTSFSLQRKVALVTGASYGIGFAISSA